MPELPREWATVPTHVNWPAPHLEAVDVPGGDVELQDPNGRRVALVEDDLVVDVDDLA
jgi:hypothetical protein